MKIKLLVILAIFVLIFSACSSSEETTKENQDEAQPEVYVFDDVTSDEDTTQAKEETPIVIEPESNVTQYFVQVGAFTTKERAEQFQKENSSKTTYPMNISYSDDVKLFVVQLPPFATKTEAEKVRNELWLIQTFKDAFIVTK